MSLHLSWVRCATYKKDQIRHNLTSIANTFIIFQANACSCLIFIFSLRNYVVGVSTITEELLQILNFVITESAYVHYTYVLNEVCTLNPMPFGLLGITTKK
jgi:hypothetical protein